MLLSLFFLINFLFSNSYTVAGSFENIVLDDTKLFEIKNFLDNIELYKTYEENTFFNISNQKSINLNLENGMQLNLHLFSVDQKDLIPFIKNNFNKFIHKDTLLELTKLVYEYIISEVQFFPLNPNLDSNYALCSYERADGALVMLTLFRVKLY